MCIARAWLKLVLELCSSRMHLCWNLMVVGSCTVCGKHTWFVMSVIDTSVAVSTCPSSTWFGERHGTSNMQIMVKMEPPWSCTEPREQNPLCICLSKGLINESLKASPQQSR